MHLKKMEGLEVTAMSSIYVSQAQDMPSGSPSFLNRIVKCEYLYNADELLTALEEIETELGRDAKGEKLSRTIDLDILLFGRRQIRTERLQIPHPGIKKRAFVLVPLLEIDPDLTDPVSGKALGGFLNNTAQAEVEVYKDHVARQA
jgi:2-amino-4-hydroxy-6-hydroxymethyldihydropteridine diphosphokinase